MLTPRRTGDTATTTLAIGAVAVAIICCAGLPAIAALLGGLTLGAILGLGLGAVLLGALSWTTIASINRTRRRHRRPERNRHE